MYIILCYLIVQPKQALAKNAINMYSTSIKGETKVANKNQSEQPQALVAMSMRDFFSVIIVGGVIGLLIWALGMTLNRYVFDAYLCSGDSISQCGQAKNYSALSALAVASIVSLVALMQLRVYRPLLVIIAVMIGLWGLAQLSWDLVWYQGAGICLVMYALALGTFSWILRLRQFWMALVITIVIVAALRLVL